MKKLLSLALAAALALSLTACGGGAKSSDASDKSSGANDGSASSSQSGSSAGAAGSGSFDPSGSGSEPAEPEPQFISAALGEPVSLGFVDFTMTDFGHGEKIVEGNSTLSWGLASGTEGFWLHGTLTNNTGEAVRLYQCTYVKITFDDTYSYEGTVNMMGGSEAAPLADCSVYLTADVPPKAFENAQKIAVQFAFNENFAEFDYTSGEKTAEAFDYAYEFVQDASASPASSADAGTVDAALQGTWSIAGGTFDFNSGAVVVTNQGQVMTGTYTIDVDSSSIQGTFTATDGSVNITLPYEYANNTLSVYNNQGQALVKQ